MTINDCSVTIDSVTINEFDNKQRYLITTSARLTARYTNLMDYMRSKVRNARHRNNYIRNQNELFFCNDDDDDGAVVNELLSIQKLFKLSIQNKEEIWKKCETVFHRETKQCLVFDRTQSST